MHTLVLQYLEQVHGQKQKRAKNSEIRPFPDLPFFET